uniref:Uncharacterized protein n=1 Tax=uncultured marine group II/III euryarchaeote KM3_181_C06 TaxID=1457944 RepID=A0A075GMY1_9EURY|nr:hypothetical protein [uncultured marine group II/III euryarchaeote KM3_181_C06]
MMIMGGSKCALDRCCRRPSGKSPYCWLHKSNGDFKKKKEELTAIVERLFPTNKGYRLSYCSAYMNWGNRGPTFSIQYQSNRKQSSYYLQFAPSRRERRRIKRRHIFRIEIYDILSKDLTELETEIQRALEMRFSPPPRTSSRSSTRSGSAGISKSDSYYPTDDDINSVDGGPPSEAYDDASDDDG